MDSAAIIHCWCCIMTPDWIMHFIMPYIYMYIYICRERERERDGKLIFTTICIKRPPVLKHHKKWSANFPLRSAPTGMSFMLNKHLFWQNSPVAIEIKQSPVLITQLFIVSFNQKEAIRNYNVRTMI